MTDNRYHEEIWTLADIATSLSHKAYNDSLAEMEAAADDKTKDLARDASTMFKAVEILTRRIMDLTGEMV